MVRLIPRPNRQVCDRPRVRFTGRFRRASGEVARQFLTHNVTSLPPNDALRKAYSRNGEYGNRSSAANVTGA